MKTRIQYIIIAVSIGFLCVAAAGRIEPSPAAEEHILINQGHPALVGVEKLHVVLLRYGETFNKETSAWKQLEADIKDSLVRADINFLTKTIDSIPELRIYISSLDLESSKQLIFHIRTTLARAVCLKGQEKPVFKSDIWHSNPEMLTVPFEDRQVSISKVVLKQVEDFINELNKCNTHDIAYQDINKTDPDIVTGKQTETNESKFVASRSSNIFHKPECRWAKNISERNLVTYKGKDQATKEGKRPCKTCNP